MNDRDELKRILAKTQAKCEEIQSAITKNERVIDRYVELLENDTEQNETEVERIKKVIKKAKENIDKLGDSLMRFEKQMESLEETLAD